MVQFTKGGILIVKHTNYLQCSHVATHVCRLIVDNHQSHILHKHTVTSYTAIVMYVIARRI